VGQGEGGLNKYDEAKEDGGGKKRGFEIERDLKKSPRGSAHLIGGGGGCMILAAGGRGRIGEARV